MFVQSAAVRRSATSMSPTREISIYGQGASGGDPRLCKMNLAVHGLGRRDIMP